jgi:hypothetical protein
LADSQHPVAGVVVGPLESIVYGNDLELKARPFQVVADRYERTSGGAC